MRLLQRTLLSSAIYIGTCGQGFAWEPCMPICDYGCTGKAAADLSRSAASDYASLSQAFGENGMSIASLTTTYVDMFANLGAADAQDTAQRIQAYDGLSGKTTLTIDKLAKTNSAMTDTISSQYYLMKVGQRKADEILKNGEIPATLSNKIIATSFASCDAVKDASTGARKRAQSASIYQKELAKSVSTDSHKSVQFMAFANELDWSVPSPYAHEEIDGQLWDEYQKQMFLVWNFVNVEESADINVKRNGIKRLMALDAINNLLSLNVTLDNPDPSISEKTFRTSLTANQVRLESYRRLLLDSEALDATAMTSARGLNQILNIQLAERNHLLAEILNTKKTKNNLMALSQIN